MSETCKKPHQIDPVSGIQCVGVNLLQARTAAPGQPGPGPSPGQPGPGQPGQPGPGQPGQPGQPGPGPGQPPVEKFAATVLYITPPTIPANKCAYVYPEGMGLNVRWNPFTGEVSALNGTDCCEKYFAAGNDMDDLIAKMSGNGKVFGSNPQRQVRVVTVGQKVAEVTDGPHMKRVARQRESLKLCVGLVFLALLAYSGSGEDDEE